MPLVGFTCPAGVPENDLQRPGQRNTLDHCLGKCASPCAAPPLLAAIYKANSINHHKGAYISASMLAGNNCARKVVFERFEDYFEVPRNLYWAFRGTIAHACVEGVDDICAPYGWMSEMRMQVPLEFPDLPAPIFTEDGVFTGTFDESRHLVIQMGGTCDMYNPFHRLLLDTKSMADAKVAKVIKGELDVYWERQLNIYAWLISKTPIDRKMRAFWRKHGLEPIKGKFLPAPERIAIQAIAMMELPLTGTRYQPLRTKAPSDIPELRLAALEDTEQFVRTKALEWYRYLVLREQPPVPGPEQAWLCQKCTFNGEVIPGERCFPEAERAQRAAADAAEGEELHAEAA